MLLARPLLVLALVLAAPRTFSQAADCLIAFAGPVTVDDDSPNPGQRLRLTVSLINYSNYPSDHLDVWMIARRSGAPAALYTRVLGSGVLPADAIITRTFITRTFALRVPPSLPPDAYNLDFYLGSFENNEICDFARTTLTVGPIPGTGEGAARGRGIVTPEDGPFAATVPVAVIPNPFSDRATLTFEVAEAANVRLAAYDVLGREVAVLVDRYLEPGLHEAVLDGRALLVGTYFYRLARGRDVQTGRLSLVR